LPGGRSCILTRLCNHSSLLLRSCGSSVDLLGASAPSSRGHHNTPSRRDVGHGDESCRGTCTLVSKAAGSRSAKNAPLTPAKRLKLLRPSGATNHPLHTATLQPQIGSVRIFLNMKWGLCLYR